MWVDLRKEVTSCISKNFNLKFDAIIANLLCLSYVHSATLTKNFEAYPFLVWAWQAQILPVVENESHYSLDWTTGLDYWTHPKWCKMPFPAFFQCRWEANHVYSAYLFAKFAPLACWAGVGRGQRSHVYLISFNKKIWRAVILSRKQTLAFVKA